MSHKNILLDLFFQCTDYTQRDVAWTNYNPPLFAVGGEDFALLYVKLKDGSYYSFSNQGGTFHCVKHEDINE